MRDNECYEFLLQHDSAQNHVASLIHNKLLSVRKTAFSFFTETCVSGSDRTIVSNAFID